MDANIITGRERILELERELASYGECVGGLRSVNKSLSMQLAGLKLERDQLRAELSDLKVVNFGLHQANYGLKQELAVEREEVARLLKREKELEACYATAKAYAEKPAPRCPKCRSFAVECLSFNGDGYFMTCSVCTHQNEVFADLDAALDAWRGESKQDAEDAQNAIEQEAGVS